MGPDASRLDRVFFARPTEVVAEALVGCWLVRETQEGLVAGRIVETEAYGGPADPASHAAMYPRSREAVMASAAGTVYVYRSYGVHACLNVVAKVDGAVGAVLIRAVQPCGGIALMRRRRGDVPDRDLCRGPGRLTQAFAITIVDSMTDVVARDDLWLEPAEGNAVVVRSPRVGITRAVDREWRFTEAASPFVSGRRVTA